MAVPLPVKAPLLTEFERRGVLSSLLYKLPLIPSLLPSVGDIREFRLARLFFLFALSASILSIVAGAGIIRVTLRNAVNKESPPVRIEFGYVYELNAAFFYLILSPLFAYFAIRFIRKAQFALEGLALRGQLVFNPNHAPERPGVKDPLDVLGDINRRVFSPVTLGILLLAAVYMVAGTEFLPPRGDYYKLAFGYVQAPFIKSYPTGISLKEFEARTGREINDLGPIKKSELQNWVLSEIDGGTEKPYQVVIFWVFLSLVLCVKVLFLLTAFWVSCKTAFLLRFFSKAILPSNDYPLEIKLDFEDKHKAYGLTELNKTYTYLLILIFIGAAGMTASVLTNIAKGSSKILGERGEVALPSALAQGVMASLPLIVFFFLLWFLVLMHVRTDDAKDRVATALEKRIEEAELQKDRLEGRRQLVISQTSWPDLKFKAWFGASLPSYFVPPVFLAKQPDLVKTVFEAWKFIADIFANILNSILRLLI